MDATTRGQRFYLVRLACGDGVRRPESLRAFSERIKRETAFTIHPSELSEIENDKPSKTVTADHLAAVAAVDPLKRGILWLGWNEKPAGEAGSVEGPAEVIDETTFRRVSDAEVAEARANVAAARAARTGTRGRRGPTD